MFHINRFIYRICSLAALLLLATQALAISEQDANGEIFPGETVEGEISEAGELDIYEFVVSSTSAVVIETGGSTDTLGGLYNNNIELLESDDDSGVGTNFQISATLEPGLYLVVVGGFDQNTTTGTYTLSLTLNSTSFTATQYLMTTSTSQNVTELHLINSADESQAFTGTLYNGDGEQLGEANQSLSASPVASRGRLILTSSDLEALFSVEPWSGPAVLEVSGTASFELMSKLRSPSGLVSNTNCVRQDRVLNIEGFDSSTQTYIRLINTNDSSIGPVTGTLYDGDGSAIGISGVTLAESLNAKQAIWVNRDAMANLVDSQWDGTALLDVNAISGLKLLNLNFVNDETFFNFSCFEDADSNFVYLQTTSTSQNRSITHIVNTSDSPKSYTATLYNADGQQLGTANQSLHDSPVQPLGRITITSSDLESRFDVESWTGPALLDVSSTGDFELMTKLTSPSGLVSNTNCVSRDSVHNIEGTDSEERTFVRFLNQGETTITSVTGTLYDQSGQVIGNADSVLIDSLSPKQAVWLNRDALAGQIGSTWTGEATLTASAGSDSALRLLNLDFVNDETFFNFSCYESSNQAPVASRQLENQSVRTGDVNIPLGSAFYDPDSDQQLDVTVTGLPPGLSFDGTAITGTIDDAAAGTYSVRVIGTDDALDSVSHTFTLTVATGEWIQGLFEPAQNFEAMCASPRSGIDTFSGELFPDVQGTTLDENNWLRSWSNDLYLWYDEIVDRDPVDYSTLDYFEILKTDETTETGAPKDNFHFAADTLEFEESQQGETFGYGARFVLISSSPPRQMLVSKVEPGSSADNAGLTRGAEVIEIDGVDLINGNDTDTLNTGLLPSNDGETHEFTVIDLGSSNSRTVTLTAGNVEETQVKAVTAIDTNTGRVGYFEFSDHIAPAEQQLISAFNQLIEEEVTDLVLDLRYNGGGLVGIAAEVAYMIAGANNTANRVFIEYEYNDKHTEFDPFNGTRLQPFGFPTTAIGYSAIEGEALPSLNLNRVFILTSASTCSASELIINTLRGIDVEVIQIGDTTCGKPFGFLPQDNCGTTYFTIQFRGLNAKGFGDYPEGFSSTSSPAFQTDLPGCNVSDDYSRLLGDPEEGQLSAALYYRENGTCPNSSARLHPSANRTPTPVKQPPLWKQVLQRDHKFEKSLRF